MGARWLWAGLENWHWCADREWLPQGAAALKSCSIFYLPLRGVLIKIADVQGLIPQSAAQHLAQSSLAVKLCPGWFRAWLSAGLIQGSLLGHHCQIYSFYQRFKASNFYVANERPGYKGVLISKYIYLYLLETTGTFLWMFWILFYDRDYYINQHGKLSWCSHIFNSYG